MRYCDVSQGCLEFTMTKFGQRPNDAGRNSPIERRTRIAKRYNLTA